jgi:DNA-binding GntR family transcriptional regulator
MHRTIVQALQSRDAPATEKALAAHFRAPNRRDISLDDETMRLLDWQI